MDTTMRKESCLGHFKQYFSYIVAVSFIGGGNWITQRIMADFWEKFD
jgi:hypothetical protein